jgi:hypothetical protein
VRRDLRGQGEEPRDYFPVFRDSGGRLDHPRLVRELVGVEATQLVAEESQAVRAAEADRPGHRRRFEFARKGGAQLNDESLGVQPELQGGMHEFCPRTAVHRGIDPLPEPEAPLLERAFRAGAHGQPVEVGKGSGHGVI